VPADRLSGPEQGEVVVLQHDSIEQPQPVIPAAPAGHRVFFQHTVARGRFAGVQQPGPAGPERRDIARGLGGHAREPLQEVQDDAFGG
jgi:hypothetical protein